MTQKDIGWEIEKMVWLIEDSRTSRHHNFIEHIKRYLPLLNNEGWEILKHDLNERQYNYVLKVRDSH